MNHAQKMQHTEVELQATSSCFQFPCSQCSGRIGTAGMGLIKKKFSKHAKQNHPHAPLQARKESTASFCSQISDVQLLHVRACTRKEHFHLSGIFQYLFSSASPGLPRPHPKFWVRKFWVGPGDKARWAMVWSRTQAPRNSLVPRPRPLTRKKGSGDLQPIPWASLSWLLFQGGDYFTERSGTERNGTTV